MLKTLDKECISMTCQHCSEKISYAWVCKVDSFIGRRYVYFCSVCQKVLNVSKEQILSEIP